jgi:hypothetical protein
MHYALVPHFDCAVPDQFVTAEDVKWHREEGEEFAGIPFDADAHPFMNHRQVILIATNC